MKRMGRALAALCALALLLTGCGAGREKAYYYAIICGQNGSTLKTLSEPEDLAVMDEFLQALGGMEAQEPPEDLTVRMEYVQYRETDHSVRQRLEGPARTFEEATRLTLYLDTDWVSVRDPSGDQAAFHRVDAAAIQALVDLRE